MTTVELNADTECSVCHGPLKQIEDTDTGDVLAYRCDNCNREKSAFNTKLVTKTVVFLV